MEDGHWEETPRGQHQALTAERASLPDDRGGGLREKLPHCGSRASRTASCAHWLDLLNASASPILPFFEWVLLWCLSLTHHCIPDVCWAVWAVRSIALSVYGYPDHTHGYPGARSGPHGEGLTFEMTALTGWGFGVPPLGRGRCAL